MGITGLRPISKILSTNGYSILNDFYISSSMILIYYLIVNHIVILHAFLEAQVYPYPGFILISFYTQQLRVIYGKESLM